MGLVLRGRPRCEDILTFVESTFKGDLHATYGVMDGASVAVTVIGRSIAQAREILMKSAIKQIERQPVLQPLRDEPLTTSDLTRHRSQGRKN